MTPSPEPPRSRGDRALTFSFYVLGTVMTALAVHLASVLAVPRRAERDAYARVSALAGGRPSRTIVVPPEQAIGPEADPAVTTAFCLYDLAAAPARVEIDVGNSAFVAVSLHGRYGRTYYGLTGRSASGGRIALVLRTPRQAEEAATREGDAPAADLGVVLPEPVGFAEAQVLAAEPSEAEGARAVAGRLSCAAVTEK